MKHLSREVWIGLVEMVQRPGTGVLLDRNNAFANVLGMASAKDDFEDEIRKAADSLGFEVVAVTDAEPLCIRRSEFVVDEDLLVLAAEVEQTGETRFGTLHTWTSEE